MSQTHNINNATICTPHTDIYTAFQSWQLCSLFQPMFQPFGEMNYSIVISYLVVSIRPRRAFVKVI